MTRQETTKAEYVGQSKFREVLKRGSGFQEVWLRLNMTNFQDAWKAVTGVPQHGNFNPNYIDVLRFIEAANANSVWTEACPIFPIENGLDPTWRDDLENEQCWQTMFNFCLVYREFVRRNMVAPKRSGVIEKMFNDGYIDGEPGIEECFNDLVGIAIDKYGAEFAE